MSRKERRRHPRARQLDLKDYSDPTTGWTAEDWLGTTTAADKKPFQFKRCAHPVTQVIVIDDVPISVSDGSNAAYRTPPGFVILNCTGSPNYGRPAFPKGFEKLSAHLPPPTVTELTLDWPDGGLPPVKVTFWRALIEGCAKAKAPLLLHCIGGHGRTGTALAAILISYSIPAEDAIKFVRENHCDRAIETQSQEDYLVELDREINGGAL